MLSGEPAWYTEAIVNTLLSQAMFRIYRRVPTPRIRLVCFGYAGAGATIFHAWPNGLAKDVEVCAVQLPGRQERLSHPPFTRVSAIVEAVALALVELSPSPWAFFGHSFGALVAFELARRLRGTAASPLALIVGAGRLPQSAGTTPNIYDASPGGFADALHGIYGTPRAILEDEDLMSVALPSLRADFEALDTYAYVRGEPLDVALTVLHGRKDKALTLAEAHRWGELSARGCTVHEVDAGHFFVDTHRAWVLERVAERLSERAGG